MDLSLNENQVDLKKSATEFAKIKLCNDVEERDRKGEFSRDGWNACADFGLQGILVPEQFGGMGLNAIDYAAIMEGAGYGAKDNGLIFSVNAHNLVCIIPVLHHGSDEIKEKYLPALVSGKMIGANAMTEADAGSDMFSNSTTAEKKEDYYILNGGKTFVTNAPVADAFIIYAATNKSKGFFGLSGFLVERETEGLTVGNKMEKMGLRTSPISDVAVNSCKVPATHLLGKEGAGGILFGDTMEWERGLIMASCIGVMERQLDSCRKYAHVRKVGNQSIGKYQAIAHKIAEMKVRIETSRLMLYKAAWLKSQKKTATLETAAAKLYISESYIENCREAMKIYGGYGYMVEYGLERELRDALASQYYSGTSEIQKNIISSMIL
jgi:alkylation response protein AidB-like acyl-CoA dehydrogenase